MAKALAKALVKTMDGYSQYVAFRNAALSYPASSASSASVSKSSNVLSGLITVPVSASSSVFSSTAQESTSNTSALLSDFSYGLDVRGLGDARVDSPMNWASGQPLSQNQPIMKININ